MSLLRALAVAALGAALVLPLAVAQQASPPSADATGYAALLPGGNQGPAVASSTGSARRTSEITGLRPVGGGSVDVVTVEVSAVAEGDGGVAEGSVRATGLTLLDGRVVIGSLRMSARAAGGAGDGATGVTDGLVSGLTVDGAPVTAGRGSRVAVPGVGALVFLESVSDGAGVVHANALRVEVSDPAAAAVIGRPFVIGHVDLRATAGTAGDAATTSPDDPTPTAPRRAPATAPRAEPPPDDPAPDRDTAAPDPRVSPPFTPTPSLGVPRRPAPRASISPGAAYVFPALGDAGFTDDYGAPRAGTGWHQGNDIFAPTGTPLVAVADGSLSRVGVNTLGGNRLWLTDDAGNTFYYAHLSAYAPVAVEGARVSAGEVIGFVGNTGQAITTPPHLHFEIHPGDGDSVNPYPYLLAWQRGGDIPQAFSQAATSTSPAPAAGAVLVDGIPAIERAPAPADGLATPAS